MCAVLKVNGKFFTHRTLSVLGFIKEKKCLLCAERIGRWNLKQSDRTDGRTAARFRVVEGRTAGWENLDGPAIGQLDQC